MYRCSRILSICLPAGESSEIGRLKISLDKLSGLSYRRVG